MEPEKINETAEETAENKEPETVEEISAVPPKKHRAGKIIALILIVAAATVAFSVPQSREKIITTAKEAVAKLKQPGAYEVMTLPLVNDEYPVADLSSQTAEDNQPSPVAAQGIDARLEQLENARDFEHAEQIIATADPAAKLSAEAKYDALEQRLRTLERRLDMQEKDTDHKIGEVRKAIPNTGLMEDNVRRLLAQGETHSNLLVKLTERTENVEKNKADASFVLSLDSRMIVAERKLRASNTEKERASALLLAIYQMRDAIARGQKFPVEQQAARALASFSKPLEAKLNQLTPFAEQGVWTQAALEQTFDAFADAAVLAEKSGLKKDWFHRALDKLREQVIVRRIDAPAEDLSTQAVLARAGQAVARGDLMLAVIQLKPLKGIAAEKMMPWISSAEKTLYVRKAVNESLAAALGLIYAQQGDDE